MAAPPAPRSPSLLFKLAWLLGEKKLKTPILLPVLNFKKLSPNFVMPSKAPFPVITYKLLLASAADAPPDIQIPPYPKRGSSLNTDTCASLEALKPTIQP